ncbi:hypothetical protein EOD39_7286 [Acipenser ruthenus]|uniref:Endonuclease/exonuclease/phosphatase domain-containing protein n=1 Tax=Acipenser ruthenus TaxID=7906 RepID=A0A444U7C6_ACIRT|nr:hypothetical protein EOD39_7286 [Acipenser ruthenus]
MHSLHLATPKGYSLFDKPHLTGQGGGTAVIANSVLASSVLSLLAISSFEHRAIKLLSPMSLTLAVIYCPPKSKSAFIAEFSEFLSLICTSTDKILLLGDLNIHVDLPSSPLVTDFNTLLDCLGLSQSVNVPNHTRGHTLDLSTRTVKKDRNCPWYTLELRLLKSACHKLERKWRSSGLTVHREIWTDHLVRKSVTKANLL